MISFLQVMKLSPFLISSFSNSGLRCYPRYFRTDMRVGCTSGMGRAQMVTATVKTTQGDLTWLLVTGLKLLLLL